MSSNQVQFFSEANRARNAFWISAASCFTYLLTAVPYVYIGVREPSWQIFALIGITVAVILISAYSTYLCQKDRVDFGIGLLLGAILIDLPLVSSLLQGVGLFLGIMQLILATAVIGLTLSKKYHAPFAIANVVSSILTILLDGLGPSNRIQVSALQTLLPVLVAAIAVLLFVLLLVSFKNFSLRAKITIGILLSGGVALGFLSFFAIDRASRIVFSLADRLETSVSLLAEEQLINTVFAEANVADRFFREIAEQTHRLAEYRIALQNQHNVLSQGIYWNAQEKLIPLEGGKYGNPASDISSVFVPSFVTLDDSVIKELNTNAYLDFSAPLLLKENPALLAVYYIDERGVVRYYPNIELASLLPPDFDATQRPYYKITAPLFNPQRNTRWTIPYVDAAGGGLVVTVAEPVYIRNTFRGVVAADVQLSTITQQISAIKVGQSGYAFMLDDAGRIISMPAAGYAMFGLDPNALPPNEYFKQTVLGAGSEELRAITSRMVAGGNGLNIIPVNGVDTYIAYTRIPTNGYSLAIVVPVSEMQTAIALARSETEAQTQSAIRTAALILLVLFAAAVGASFAIGQVIAAPVLRLTQTANRIIEGDLNAHADVTSRDEIGALAKAFNAMTLRLRETLQGLEKRVEERTAELVAANERNERRAKQFESIAQVARTIASTRNLEVLLNQITTAISREFGFYHVGIFLVDNAGEYAVLSAANSEGGKRMLARGHRLKVGEVGLVGYVTGSGKPRIALDVGADAVFFNNPDLPDTRSEITLPLRAGEEVIGALDVQSTEPHAFSQEDVNILSTLADLVSIAIQNARQFEETRRALSEAEALSRQFVQTGWSQFTKRQKITGIHHTGVKATLLYRKNGASEEQSALDADQARTRRRGAVLTLPVKLRGEVIGTVSVRAPDNRQWDQDELDIVTAIIERAALAMENARLLMESQKLAAKERTIGEISAKISAQSDIDELIKTAAWELSRTLPGAEIAIQFIEDESE